MATFTIGDKSIQHLYLYDKEENNVGGADFIGPVWDCWFLFENNNYHLTANAFDEALAWLREKGKLIWNPKIVAFAEFEL